MSLKDYLADLDITGGLSQLGSEVSIVLIRHSEFVEIQGDQLNMVPLKSDMSSLHVYSGAHWTSYLLQCTIKTRPCLTGHPVQCDAIGSNQFMQWGRLVRRVP